MMRDVHLSPAIRPTAERAQGTIGGTVGRSDGSLQGRRFGNALARAIRVGLSYEGLGVADPGSGATGRLGVDRYRAPGRWGLGSMDLAVETLLLRSLPQYHGIRALFGPDPSSGGGAGRSPGGVGAPDAERPRSLDSYAPIVAAASRQNGLDPALVAAVIEVESGFNPRAVSAAGAKGLMQLMDGTARSLGVSDPFDVRQNISGGARLLRQLLDRYAGNVRLALAAYNAGSGAVDRYGDVPPYPETASFVPRVLEAAERWRRRTHGAPNGIS